MGEVSVHGLGGKVACIHGSNRPSQVSTVRVDTGLAMEKAESVVLKADLGRREERAGVMDKIIKHFGRVDILVNNAGLQFFENAETCTQEQWDVSRNVLLDVVFALSQQAIPFMKKQGGGKIINITSICAFREGSGNFSYGVMKGRSSA